MRRCTDARSIFALALVMVAAPAAAQESSPGEPIDSRGGPAGSSTTVLQPGDPGRAAPADPVADESAAEREARQREEARQQRLEDEDDDGRDSDILWIEAFVGYSYANLIQFRQENFLPEAATLESSGYTAGGAAGFRVKFLMIGARAGIGAYDGFDIGTILAEIHLRLPVPVVEPYIRAGFGFAWLGTVNYDSPKDSETTVNGLAVDAGLGLDVYLGDYFAVGGGIDASFLNMTRQSIAMGCNAGDCSPTTVDLEEDGDSIGLQIRATVHASLHF